MSEVKNECWILLKPSAIHGVGVFTERAIGSGEKLRIWEPGDWQCVGRPSGRLKIMCNRFSDGKYRPENFIRMSLAWYMNHSKEPNCRVGVGGHIVSLRKIKRGEELTLNYKHLMDGAKP